MQNTPDGGPAFPQSVSAHDGIATASYDFVDGAGMSLRDYFAAQAMPQVIAHIMVVRATMIKPGQFNFDEIGDTAYQVADAMLRARAVHSPSATPSPAETMRAHLETWGK